MTKSLYIGEVSMSLWHICRFPRFFCKKYTIIRLLNTQQTY